MSKHLQNSSSIKLPEAPSNLKHLPVIAWEEAIEIDTYLPIEPEPYPMFFENRVYQGSSGKVYPLQFFNRIEKIKKSKTWRAIHLENTFVRLVILPELGGRIHVGLDKTNDYDFLYRNNVIKPALVGLAGPWISGGIEFNWPQHHRPSTFLPVDCEIEEHEDGSRTVWSSDRDPFTRLRESHGITLRPESSLIEIKVRLNNPTELRQTFLWWANMAVPVNDRYQSFFPEDVSVVADHARRAITGFPQATGKYYGIDYKARVTPERPDADRLDWYRNIPVPTSYMCLGSKGDFFGGYDHGRDAGLVHWADHRIAPGKKQWTWGNSKFGKAWDRNLTDTDGPYIELMAGVFTDNQPDFSFLEPGETKTFSQYVYPIQKMGPPKFATRDYAINLTHYEEKEELLLKVYSSKKTKSLILLQDFENHSIWETEVALSPGEPFITGIPMKSDDEKKRLVLIIYESGEEVLRYKISSESRQQIDFEAARAPDNPKDVKSTEELHIIGQHLTQYRHATRLALPYWKEALRRDPFHTNSLIALAESDYRLGNFEEAKSGLLKALVRLTTFNSNPVSSEANYLLGLTYRQLNENSLAFDCFAKATWDLKYKSASLFEMGKIRSLERKHREAISLLNEALKLNSDFAAIRCLIALSKKSLGLTEEFSEDIVSILKDFPSEWSARYLSGLETVCDIRTKIDIAIEYASAGFYLDAKEILISHGSNSSEFANSGASILILYYLAWLENCLGDLVAEKQALSKARFSNKDRCFPFGIHDLKVLLSAITSNPTDHNAHALLGNLYYSSKNYDHAIFHWQAAIALNPKDATSHRNLAIAFYNKGDQAAQSLHHYEEAIKADPDSSLLIFERDQLAKRTGTPTSERLSFLKKHSDKLEQRDDLMIEFISLLLLNSSKHEALAQVSGRYFQPWEGGEGKVLNLWQRINVHLSRDANVSDDLAGAVQFLLDALSAPDSLGEDHHPLANRSEIHLLLGDNLRLVGDVQGSIESWTIAAHSSSDFRGMAPKELSDKSFYSIEALGRLKLESERDGMIESLTKYANDLLNDEPEVDYFATSLPRLLLFKDNTQANRDIERRTIEAQINYLNGDIEAALGSLADLIRIDPSNEVVFDLLTYMRLERIQE
jgi:tetratricopeptide (TPR) repeat protein